MKKVLENILLTLTVFVTIFIFSFVPINCNSLNPIKEAIFDLDVNDIIFSKLREEQKVDTNIVLINVGELERYDIYRMIKRVNQFNPKIIALDILFKEPKDPIIDFILQSELKKCKNLVMISELSGYNNMKDYYSGNNTSLDKFVENASLGFANLPESNIPDSYTIRDFNPYVKSKSDTLYSFSTVISRIISKEKFGYLMNRNNDREIINFRGNFDKFYKLEYNEVLDSAVDLSFINNKIVLFGFMGRSKYDKSLEDIYFTPINNKYAGKSFPDMYGVVIHANIVSAILNKSYIDKMSDFLSYALAFVICYLNVWYVLFVRRERKNWFSALTSIALLIQSTGSLIIGLLVFGFFNYKVNLTLIMISIFIVPSVVGIYLVYDPFSQKHYQQCRSYLVHISISSKNNLKNVYLCLVKIYISFKNNLKNVYLCLVKIYISSKNNLKNVYLYLIKIYISFKNKFTKQNHE